MTDFFFFEKILVIDIIAPFYNIFNNSTKFGLTHLIMSNNGIYAFFFFLVVRVQTCFKQKISMNLMSGFGYKRERRKYHFSCSERNSDSLDFLEYSDRELKIKQSPIRP